MTYSEILDLISQIEYKDWRYVFSMDGPRPYVQIQFTDPSTKEKQFCRKWLLSQHMTPGELVQTCFKATLSAEEHECRENFRWKDRAIFGPHLGLNTLWENAKRTQTR